jgi:16S rRNA (guanine527-N7)-methyltransferase
MENIKVIQEAFEKIDIFISEKQAEQFYRYYEMLVQKNKVMNLTAITEFYEVISKHFVDSLMIKQILDSDPHGKLIDVGTGAGFPGIPLKIVYPELEVVLMDSLNKRVQFLNEVIEELDLKKITAVHGRAEDLAKKDEYREQFDYCVSRAVANLASLSEYCIPFVRVGGSFISYKSGKVEEELQKAQKAITILGGSLVGKKETTLPDSDIYRCLLNIRKEKSTPKKYPRKAGMPTKEPIR